MRIGKKLYPWILLTPGFVAILVTIVYSWFLDVSYAFTKSIFFLDPPGAWNGFGNFVTAISDPTFLGSIGGVGLFSGSLIVIDTALGLLVASMLNRKFRGVSIIMSLILLPWIIATAASSVMWRLFLDPRFGIVDVLLTDVFHLVPPASRVLWLANPTYAWITLILVGVWKGYPLFAVVFLAAMKGVPREQYEVAVIEGANSWRRFRHVTFPHILPVVILMNLFLIIWSSSGVEFVYTLTGGGPGTTTMILPVLAYRNMFVASNVGVASAQMLLLLAIISVILTLIIRASRLGGPKVQ